MRESGEGFERIAEPGEPFEGPVTEDSVARDRVRRLLGRTAWHGAEEAVSGTDVIPDHVESGDVHADQETAERTTEGRLEPRAFVSDAEAAEYGRTVWGPTLEALPQDQKESLQRYSQELGPPAARPARDEIDYHDVNGALRGDPSAPMTEEIREDVRRLDEALDQHPLTEPVIVSRGTGIDHWSFSPWTAEGKVLTEDGYMSTSLGGPAKPFDRYDAMLHLEVPAGTPALYLHGESASFGDRERELLLGRGREWRIDQVEWSDELRQWQIYGKVLR